jgi:hypothetical protein
MSGLWGDPTETLGSGSVESDEGDKRRRHERREMEALRGVLTVFVSGTYLHVRE